MFLIELCKYFPSVCASPELVVGDRLDLPHDQTFSCFGGTAEDPLAPDGTVVHVRSVYDCGYDVPWMMSPWESFGSYSG